MSEQEFPVTLAVTRPDGSIEQVRVGTALKQGMPIMDAGDTGSSFHNHLHMHVVPDPGPGASGDYRDFGGNGDTLPFVFSDEDAPSDGVLKHFDWYHSSNTRKQS